MKPFSDKYEIMAGIPVRNKEGSNEISTFKTGHSGCTKL
jgi:hypothetical protein